MPENTSKFGVVRIRQMNFPVRVLAAATTTVPALPEYVESPVGSGRAPPLELHALRSKSAMAPTAGRTRHALPDRGRASAASDLIVDAPSSSGSRVGQRRRVGPKPAHRTPDIDSRDRGAVVASALDTVGVFGGLTIGQLVRNIPLAVMLRRSSEKDSE